MKANTGNRKKVRMLLALLTIGFILLGACGNTAEKDGPAESENASLSEGEPVSDNPHPGFESASL